MDDHGHIEETDGEFQSSRLSTIRESMGSSLAGSVNSATFTSSPFAEQGDADSLRNSVRSDSQLGTNAVESTTPTQTFHGFRRPF